MRKDWRKVLSLNSTWDYCQGFSLSQTDTPQAGFKLVQNLSLNFVDGSHALVMMWLHFVAMVVFPCVFESQKKSRSGGASALDIMPICNNYLESAPFSEVIVATLIFAPMNFGKIVARPSIYAINKLVTNLSKQDSYTMINLEKVVFYSSRYFFKWKIWCKFLLILWFSAATKVWQNEFNHIFLLSYCKMTFILFFTQVIIKIFF